MELPHIPVWYGSSLLTEVLQVVSVIPPVEVGGWVGWYGSLPNETSISFLRIQDSIHGILLASQKLTERALLVWQRRG